MIPMPETPWYLGEDYDPSEIVFDDKGGVKAGTLRALVARLTPHGSTCMSFLSFTYFPNGGEWRLVMEGRKERKLMIDTAFFQAFVLTFRSFTSGDELMDLLLERYNIQPPPGLNAGEMIDWTKQKQTPIRLRYVFSSSLYLLSVLATRFAASARSCRSSLRS
jgi:son of sevenless-like protein